MGMRTLLDLKPTATLPMARIAVGVAASAVPEAAGRLLGFELAENPEAVLFARAFGIRDVALGVGALASGREDRRLWLAFGLVCDLGDITAGVLGLRAGGPKRGNVMAAIAASSGVALSVAALVADRRRRDR